MRSKAWYFFLYGQIWLYSWLIITIIIRPLGLTANSGVRFYGIYLNTVITYSIALLGTAYWNWRSAHEMVGSRLLIFSLRLMSLCLIGIVLTPYSFGIFFDDTHTALGALLFIIQLVASARIAFILYRRLTTIVLWLVELGAGIVSALYVFPSQGYLIESQIIFQLAFGTIVIIFLGRRGLQDARRPVSVSV